MEEEYYLTKEKKAELEAELLELKGPKRREIIENLEYAKSLGDLSENAEYHQARENQGELEAKIQKIERILQNSKVISSKGGKEFVEIGSKVLVQKEGLKEKTTYQLVGSEEADMALGKLSIRSPFGSALLGCKKGQKISLETPNGKANYKIIDVY